MGRLGGVGRLEVWRGVGKKSALVRDWVEEGGGRTPW